MKSAIMSLFLLSIFAGNALTWGISKAISIPSPHSKEISLYQEKKKSDEKASYLEIPGFDKNSKIVVMFNNSGTVKSREIPGKVGLEAASKKITDWTNLNKKMPLIDEGQLLIKGCEDQWGNQITYKLINGSQGRLRSNGPDKKSFSKWDSVLYLNYAPEKVAEDKPAKSKTWLEKRKEELSYNDDKSTDKNAVDNFKLDYQVGGLKKIEGANYFWFFTGLMLLASFAFIPVARFYTRSFLKQKDAEPTELDHAEAEANFTQH